MTLTDRFDSWQQAADHHAPEYFWLALRAAPVVIRKRPTILRVRAIQTWLLFPATGTTVRVTYKRHTSFAGKRIELQIDRPGQARVTLYFGPGDLTAIERTLAPL